MMDGGDLRREADPVGEEGAARIAHGSSRDPAILAKRLGASLATHVPESLVASVPVVDDAETITRLIRILLRKRIIGVGHRISGESLAEALDVHRNTISKVLGTLEKDGYVHRRRGRPAVVVALEPVLPSRRTARRISHTQMAKDHRLAIRTVSARIERLPIEDLALDQREQADVATRLALQLDDEVIAYRRIRELRAEGGGWTPAIAETAYFAERRVSDDFYDGLSRVDSILDYLEEHDLAPVTSEYRIRIAPLPEAFIPEWSARARVPERLLEGARFLRFENTSYCRQGPVEFSIANLAEGLFTLSSTELSVEIETTRLAPPRADARYQGRLRR
jgi:DNA-binding GntR family transcriptional regulator